MTNAVIAGPPSSPITKSISLDLERRGFIVYVVVNSVEEEQTVQSEARVDIRPLNLDIVDVGTLLARLTTMLIYGVDAERAGSNRAIQQPAIEPTSRLLRSLSAQPSFQRSYPRSRPHIPLGSDRDSLPGALVRCAQCEGAEHDCNYTSVLAYHL